jgi:CRP-like cAMP-binding protein
MQLGGATAYYVDRDGNEYTKSFCAENSFVAAYSALLLEQPSRLFIQALEDTKLLIADYSAYRVLSENHACWQALNCKIAEFLFIKKEKRESALLLDDAKTRYLSFQEEYPGLETRIRQHHIASYLGITPVTLSRIRTQLKSH